MNQKIKFFIIPTIIVSLINFSGCKTLNKKQIRQNHIDKFNKSLEKNKLNNKTKYSLNDCLTIALKNNLTVKAKLIEKTITTLDKKAAFSYLLPKIDANFQTNNWSKEQLVKSSTDSSGNPIFAPMQEDSFNTAALSISFPILTPSAWFMYSMRKKNEDISSLSFELTKQMISMKVTILYFTILGLERVKENVIHQIKSSNTLNVEINNLYLEGLLPLWQKTQGEAYLLSRKKDLKEVENAILERKSELLFEMGYSPLDKICIEKNYIFKDKNFNLEELIYDALISHPALYLQDKIIDINKDGIKTALANFLPNIFLYANLNKTTNSFLKYSTYWMSGIQGMWSIFNGFKNIADYKIAKKKHELEFIKREKACLSTILTVTKAYLAYKNSIENLKLSEINLEASNQKLTDITNKWKEGMETNSNYYKIIADKDYALTLKIQAEIMKQVSIANLYNVIGKTYTGKERTDNE